MKMGDKSAVVVKNDLFKSSDGVSTRLLPSTKDDDMFPEPRARFERNEIALDVLSILFADVQWMGPLTAVYCHVELEMSLARTGIIMFVQYIFGVLMNPVCGHLFDNLTWKRMLMSVAFLLTASTYLLLIVGRSFGAVLMIILMQSCITGMYMPGINSLTLGLVGTTGFPRRCTRNEMFRHVGVVMSGLLPAVFVPQHGWANYFILSAVLATLGGVVVLAIDGSKIDHERARGNEAGATSTRGVGEGMVVLPYREVFTHMPVVLLIAAVIAFHTGNAAMLPMLGNKIEELSHHNDTAYKLPIVGYVDGTVGVGIAETIAEVLSIPVAFVAGMLANRQGWGRRRVALIGFGILPVRGLCLVFVDTIPGLLATQLMDAVGASICGVTSIMMAQDLAQGTGRFSALQGAVAASLGLGSALSQIIGGQVADAHGYSAMFMTLTCLALVALLIMVVMKETCPELLGKTAEENDALLASEDDRDRRKNKAAYSTLSAV